MPHLYTSCVPKVLSETQYWFAKIISQPFQLNAKLPEYSPTGQLISLEATKYIVPSKLKPHERIQIYYCQYWWRLINIMQESFPLVLRMFGYAEFNEKIAIPFLVKYPPNNWSLNYLGKMLPQWIKEEYHEPDQQLVYDAALLDDAFVDSFIASHAPPLEVQKIVQEGGTDNLLTLKIYLQPHLHLFEWKYDLFSFRKDFLEKEPGYWEDNDFPELKKDRPYSFVFFRGINNDLYWREITPSQAWLMRLFQKGATIEEACEAIEQEDEEMYNEVVKNIQTWFHEWSRFKWLTKQRVD